jgi:hypothetical protein
VRTASSAARNVIVYQDEYNFAHRANSTKGVEVVNQWWQLRRKECGSRDLRNLPICPQRRIYNQCQQYLKQYNIVFFGPNTKLYINYKSVRYTIQERN